MGVEADLYKVVQAEGTLHGRRQCGKGGRHQHQLLRVGGERQAHHCGLGRHSRLEGGHTQHPSEAQARELGGEGGTVECPMHTAALRVVAGVTGGG